MAATKVVLDSATLDVIAATLEALRDEKYTEAKQLGIEATGEADYDQVLHVNAVAIHAGVCHALNAVYRAGYLTGAQS